jgi:hypothetical protein
MDRQARTSGNCLVKSREVTGRKEPNTAVVAGKRRGKDDRKQKTWLPCGWKEKG